MGVVVVGAVAVQGEGGGDRAEEAGGEGEGLLHARQGRGGDQAPRLHPPAGRGGSTGYAGWAPAYPGPPFPCSSPSQTHAQKLRLELDSLSRNGGGAGRTAVDEGVGRRAKAPGRRDAVADGDRRLDRVQLVEARHEDQRQDHPRQELEVMADPTWREVELIRKRIDKVNRQLKPHGKSCLKKEKEYKMCLEAYNEKSNEKATLVNRLMELMAFH